MRDEFDVTLLANPIAGLADRLATAIRRPIDLQIYHAYTPTRLNYGRLQANRLGRATLARRALNLAAPRDRTRPAAARPATPSGRGAAHHQRRFSGLAAWREAANG